MSAALRRAAALLPHSLAPATLLGCIELIKAARMAEFEGYAYTLWPGWFATVAIYFCAIMVAACLVQAIWRSLPAWLAAGLSAMLLWAAMLATRTDHNWPLTAAVLAVLPVAAWGCTLLFSSTRRAAMAIVVTLLTVMSAAAYEHYTRPMASGHAVVFIVADALRADASLTEDTPNMRRLAKRGFVFRNAIAPAPWTLPSMHAVAAGQFKPLPQGGAPAGDAGPWLPFSMRKVHGLIGNVLLGGSDGFTATMARQGEVKVLYSIGPEYQGTFALAPFMQHALAAAGIDTVPHRPLDTTRVLLRSFERAIASNTGDTAYYVHLMDPHDPYAPPKSPTFFCPSPAKQWGDKQLDAQRKITLTEEEQREARRLYDAEVRYVDQALGRMMDAIDASGMGERTTIVFLADHGEEFWDHGGFYHGHTLYQEQLHVPLIIAGPGILPGESNVPVSTTEIVPALWGLTGEKRGKEYPAGNLERTLRQGTTPPPAPVFAYGTVDLDWVQHDCAVVNWPHKLILHRDGQTVELYDLAADPAETIRLERDLPEKAQELKAALQQWQKENHLTEPMESEDDATRERLEALGYL